MGRDRSRDSSQTRSKKVPETKRDKLRNRMLERKISGSRLIRPKTEDIEMIEWRGFRKPKGIKETRREPSRGAAMRSKAVLQVGLKIEVRPKKLRIDRLL